MNIVLVGVKKAWFRRKENYIQKMHEIFNDQ